MRKGDVQLLRRLMSHRKSSKGLASVLVRDWEYHPKAVTKTRELLARDQKREVRISRELRRRGKKDPALQKVLGKVGVLW